MRTYSCVVNLPQCSTCDFWGGVEASYDIRTPGNRFESLYIMLMKLSSNYNVVWMRFQVAVTPQTWHLITKYTLTYDPNMSHILKSTHEKKFKQFSGGKIYFFHQTHLGVIFDFKL